MNTSKKTLKRLDDIFSGLGMPAPEVEIQSRADAIMASGMEPVAEHTHRPVVVTQCGKHAFTTEGQCRQAIKNRLRKNSDADGLRPYHCGDCGCWHMTSRKRFRR